MAEIGTTADAIMMGIALLFGYLIIYRKNRLFGNIYFIIFGLLIMYLFREIAGLGLLVTIGGFANMIYDLLTPKRPKIGRGWR